MTPLPLFEVETVSTPRPERLALTSPEVFAFWHAFRRGRQGESALAPEPDARVTQYAAEGYRVGQLFRPLACMAERRR